MYLSCKWMKSPFFIPCTGLLNFARIVLSAASDRVPFMHSFRLFANDQCHCASRELKRVKGNSTDALIHDYLMRPGRLVWARYFEPFRTMQPPTPSMRQRLLCYFNLTNANQLSRRRLTKETFFSYMFIRTNWNWIQANTNDEPVNSRFVLSLSL